MNCTFLYLKHLMSSRSCKLGKGAFGYVVKDEKGNAQKHFFKDCQEAALRETTIGKLMNHKSVMRIIKNQYTPDEKSITMKCAIGSVEDLIESKYDYGKEFISTVVENLVAAISYIHSIGIMHRDIKPGNILILDEKRTVLTDFSLSKFECEAECHSPRCGTDHYMAPELSDCAYNMSVDDYAAGVTIMDTILASTKIPLNKYEDAIKLMKQYNSKWHEMVTELCKKSQDERLTCTTAGQNQGIGVCTAGFCVEKMQLDGVNDEIQGDIEIVLEHLDVHDKYFPQLGKVINHWKNCLLKMKKKHLIEFVICAVCLAFGFETDELFSCFAVFEQYIVAVINDMQSDSLQMYGCTTLKNKCHVRAPNREPFICEIHDSRDETDSDSSHSSSNESDKSDKSDKSDRSDRSVSSSGSSQSSVWERPVVDWASVIKSKADGKLLQMRKTTGAFAS